jgi:hypothetical protein
VALFQSTALSHVVLLDFSVGRARPLSDGTAVSWTIQASVTSPSHCQNCVCLRKR